MNTTHGVPGESMMWDSASEKERALILRIMEDLDMPADQHRRFMNLTVGMSSPPIDGEGKPFRGGTDYTVVAWGLRVHGPPTEGPLFESFMPGGQGTLLRMQCFLMYAIPMGCSLYAAMRWRPGDTMRLSLHGFEEPHKREDEDRARIGLLLFRQELVEPHRPTGSTTRQPSPDEITRAYEELVEEAVYARVTQKDVADTLGRSLSSLKPALKHHEMPWPPPTE